MNRQVFYTSFTIVFLTIFTIFPRSQARNQTTGTLPDTFTPQIKQEDSLKSLRMLEEDLDIILSNPELKSCKFAVGVYSIDTKQFYYKKNIEDMLTPASVSKLFTCFSALYKLSTNYQVKTQIYSDGTIKKGVLEGNLFIVGHGDALFSTEDLNTLVQSIKKAGITSISGSVYGDGSFFDDITDRQHYSGDRDVVEAIPPITALSIEQNVVTVIVNTNSADSKYVNVEFNPPSNAFKLNLTARVIGRPNHSRTGKGSRGAIENNENNSHHIIYSWKEHGYGGHLAQRHESRRRENNSVGIGISTKAEPDGTQLFNVSGSLEVGKSYSYKYHIYNPVLAVAGALRNRLLANGINVKGGFAVKSIEESIKNKTAKFITEFSRPIMNILSPLMKNSDNYLAENIYKILGASTGKLKNTAKEASLNISAVLDSIGDKCDDCVFNDGSGLSRRNKTNVQTIIKLLEAEENLNIGKAWDSTFSIAGVDGTLKNRMIGTLAESNLHAKTGTHSNVSSLAGFVKTLDGERLVFAMLSNGYNLGHYKMVENAIGKTLAQFFYFNIEK